MSRIRNQDLHEIAYNDERQESSVLESGATADGTSKGLPFVDREGCKYSVTIYPTEMFEKEHRKSTSVILVVTVLIVFLFTIAMFIVYDRLVEDRQSLVLRKALQSTAIVSSLFPQNVRDRLIRATDAEATAATSMRTSSRGLDLNSAREYTRAEYSEGIDMMENPIADLFPDVSCAGDGLYIFDLLCCFY